MSAIMASFGFAKKAMLTALGMATGAGVGVTYQLDKEVRAELMLHPPKLPWSHNGPLDAYDHASIRRGYQVYKQVCYNHKRKLTYMAFYNI